MKISGRIFYGWVVIVAGLIVGMASFGIRYSFGVFFRSLETAFGLSRTATSAIFSVHMVIASAASILGGWALDRYGPRRLTFLMGLCTALSLLIAGRALAIWQLYLGYSFLLAFGTGPIFPVVNSTGSRWFKKKRGFALGISGAGNAAGTFVMAPFASYLIMAYDWRTAFLILAVVSLGIVSAASLLLVGEPAEMGLWPDGEKPEMSSPSPRRSDAPPQAEGLLLSEAVKTSDFWFLSLIWLLLSLSVHLLLTHLVPHALDLGIKPMDASLIVSLMGGSSIAGRIIVGRLSDATGRKIPAVVSALTQAAALMCLIWIRDLRLFYPLAVFLGLSWGGLSSQVTVLIGDVFGVRSIGTIMGIIGVGWTVGAAIGPALGGLAFDISHNYQTAFAFGAAMMVAAAFFAGLVNTPRLHGEGFTYWSAGSRHKTLPPP